MLSFFKRSNYVKCIPALDGNGYVLQKIIQLNKFLFITSTPSVPQNNYVVPNQPEVKLNLYPFV